MIKYTFWIPTDLLKRLKEKADMIPVSAIIRRLIEMFIKGDIKFD